MKRFASTRFGFFALAAVVSGLMTLLIDPQLKWVPITLAALYAILSILFLADEWSRSAEAGRESRRTGTQDGGM